MNILFLSLSTIESFNDRGIYPDLIRELVKNGHKVFSVSSAERRKKIKTHLTDYGDSKCLVVRTLNIQKSNLLEKGIGTLSITNLFRREIKKHFSQVKFEMIIYPTPPITLYGVVKYFKKRDNAKTYLMLKDIFPQNAVDLGMLSTTGIKSPIYRFFRRQEKRLYAISDKIGCMSPANVEYVLEHNPELGKNKVEVFPNCIEARKVVRSEFDSKKTRAQYNLPQDAKIFVYGGNLGKPQSIPYIIECLKSQSHNNDVFFLIIGDGTEYSKLEFFRNESQQSNFTLLKSLPNDEFDRVLSACDVGLIFLDNRFTIPNFPSRLLSYLQAGLPVLACTDVATDIGKTIVEAGAGWWCRSDSVDNFAMAVDRILCDNIEKKRSKSTQLLLDRYSFPISNPLFQKDA